MGSVHGTKVFQCLVDMLNMTLLVFSFAYPASREPGLVLHRSWNRTKQQPGFKGCAKFGASMKHLGWLCFVRADDNSS